MICYKEYKLLKAIKKAKFIVTKNYHYQLLSLRDDGYVKIVGDDIIATQNGIRAYEEYRHYIRNITLTVLGIVVSVIIGVSTIVLTLSK